MRPAIASSKHRQSRHLQGENSPPARPERWLGAAKMAADPTKLLQPKLEAMETCRPSRAQHDTDEAPEHCSSRSRRRALAGHPLEATQETRRPHNFRAPPHGNRCRPGSQKHHGEHTVEDKTRPPRGPLAHRQIVHATRAGPEMAEQVAPNFRVYGQKRSHYSGWGCPGSCDAPQAATTHSFVFARLKVSRRKVQ